MAQFDVFRTRAAARYPLVVDIQSDVHTKLVTRVVVPMATRARYTQPATRLTPTVQVRGSDYVLLFPLMAAIPSSALGEVVDSLVAHRAILISALDLLITGS